MESLPNLDILQLIARINKHLLKARILSLSVKKNSLMWLIRWFFKMKKRVKILQSGQINRTRRGISGVIQNTPHHPSLMLQTGQGLISNFKKLIQQFKSPKAMTFRKMTLCFNLASGRLKSKNTLINRMSEPKEILQCCQSKLIGTIYP